MQNAVAFYDVEFSWPSGPATLRIPHFEVAPGEAVLVRGNSGAGKSTFLSLCAGVVAPARGTIEILGARFDQMSGRDRDRVRGDGVGVIFQMFNLIPYLSLVENVSAPCWFSARRRARASAAHGSPEKAARDLLQRLGLGAEADAGKPVATLSIGQQQRVAAARALIGEPQLIIADEPTSALDENARDAFMETFLAESARCKAALLFVSHDRALGARFSRTAAIGDMTLSAEAADR